MHDGASVDNSMLAKVAAIIQGFVDDTGESSVERLIDEARPENSPIHEAFEWNDVICGIEWRKQQSRHWHRQVTISAPVKAGTVVLTTLVHVPSQDNAGPGVYIPACILTKPGKEEEFQRSLRYALGLAASSMKMLNDLLESSTDDDARAEAISQAREFAVSLRKALELVR